MRRLGFGVVLVSLTSATVAAAPCPTADCDPALLERRTLRAARLTGSPPVIDGRLDEELWALAPAATDFVENTPRPAARASLRSEARVLVDERALYVALRYDDPEPARIVAPLARRDDETTSDWAFVEIDSRHDRRSGFSFGVNPRGVQVDGLWLDDVQYDFSWNAVWEGAAQRDARGWTAEFRIPFSQLVFNLPAGREELVWGINFYRYSPSHGTSSNWSPRYRELGGIVSYFNDLVLPAPARVDRMEITPYVAPRVGNDEGPGRQAQIRGGADVKLGLGSSFSLTATLLPDFGQVEADPSQVNLTAFELFQPERRPFFLEGLDLFRFDTSLPFSTRDVSFAEESPFYSRRIGHAATRLRGAAKLSGQTASGWGVGVLSALSDAPGATSSVARAVKSMGGGTATVGLLAANVHRFDAASQDIRDAVVVGADVQHRFAAQRYELRSWALASRLAGDAAAITRVAEAPQHGFQRPDAARLHRTPYGTTLAGLSTEARLSKVGGALRWDLVGRAITPGFDVNEIGFQRSSDWLLLSGGWRYERFAPGRAIRGWAIGSSSLGAGWTWGGESRARVIDAYASADFRNYWSTKLTLRRDLSALSMDRLRGGPALLLPTRDAVALALVTDQRKPSYATLDLAASREPASGSSSFSASPLVNLRSSDLLQWSIGASYRSDIVGWQYVGRLATDHFVARVRQHTLAFTLRADLTFSPRLVVQLYAQPFGTVGRYDAYQRLVAPRAADPSARFTLLAAGQILREAASLGLDVNGDGTLDGRLATPDAQQRSLNGSLVFRWEYRPGSFLTLVWNHQRAARSDDARASPAAALDQLLGDHPTNVLLLKTSFRIG